MSFTDTVIWLASQKGVTINRMLKDNNLGAGTFNTWQKRGTIPSGEILSRLATYFDVSTDYLLGNEQKEKPASQLSDTDLQLLDLFSKLNDEDKAMYIKLLRNQIK